MTKEEEIEWLRAKIRMLETEERFELYVDLMREEFQKITNWPRSNQYINYGSIGYINY